MAQQQSQQRKNNYAWVVLAWCAVIGSFAWPHDFRKTDVAYLLPTYAAYMVSTFLLHIAAFVLLCCAVSLLRRQYKPALAGLLLVAVCCFPYRNHVIRKPKIGGERTVRMLTANLLCYNKNEALLKEILEQDADVIVLQEYTDFWHDASQRVLKDYKHRLVYPRNDAFGAAVYSRIPIDQNGSGYVYVGKSMEPQMAFVIDHPERRFAVFNVHLYPPVGIARYRDTCAQFADLMDLLEKEKIPLVCCGDFNFNETSPQGKLVTAKGFRDAHDLAGYGIMGTWPAIGRLKDIPGVRIDHVYLSKHWTCLRCDPVSSHGSDHRPIVVDLRLDPVEENPVEENSDG